MQDHPGGSFLHDLRIDQENLISNSFLNSLPLQKGYFSAFSSLAIKQIFSFSIQSKFNSFEMPLKDAQEFYSLVKDSAPESGDSPAGYKISDTFSDFAPQAATNNGYF